MSVKLRRLVKDFKREVHKKNGQYLATTLKLRRAKLDGGFVVDCLLAMGLPFGLPFNFDESIGRPFISAAMAKRWHRKN